MLNPVRENSVKLKVYKLKDSPSNRYEANKFSSIFPHPSLTRSSKDVSAGGYNLIFGYREKILLKINGAFSIYFVEGEKRFKTCVTE